MPYPRNGPRAFAAAVAAALALPAAASAHVTLQPSTAPADGFTRLDVRVPNERDDADHREGRRPAPAGLRVRLLRAATGLEGHGPSARRLDEPIEVEGGFEVDEQVAQITWSGGRIGPGEFVDFGLSLRMPNGEAGDKLTFKALQTYDDGEVVRWIGPEDADEPAPVVTLDGAPSGGGHGAPGQPRHRCVVRRRRRRRRREHRGRTRQSDHRETGDEGADGLAIAALVVAVLALAAAAVPSFRPPAARRPHDRPVTAVAVTGLALATAAPGRRARRRQVLLAEARRHRGAHARAGEGDLQGQDHRRPAHRPQRRRDQGLDRAGQASSAASARSACASSPASRRAATRASMSVLHTDGHVMNKSWNFKLK